MFTCDPKTCDPPKNMVTSSRTHLKSYWCAFVCPSSGNDYCRRVQGHGRPIRSNHTVSTVSATSMGNTSGAASGQKCTDITLYSFHRKLHTETNECLHWRTVTRIRRDTAGPEEETTGFLKGCNTGIFRLCLRSSSHSKFTIIRSR